MSYTYPNLSLLLPWDLLLVLSRWTNPTEAQMMQCPEVSLLGEMKDKVKLSNCLIFILTGHLNQNIKEQKHGADIVSPIRVLKTCDQTPWYRQVH